jgi:hypothetical protein
MAYLLHNPSKAKNYFIDAKAEKLKANELVGSS